jgi:F-box and leucine-rich repeat protein GRR1
MDNGPHMDNQWLLSQDVPSEAETASSPEPNRDELDFYMVPNDSQSSIGVPAFNEMSVEDKLPHQSVVERLPAEILINIISKLSSSTDLRNCMLVSQRWAAVSVELLWHRPLCTYWAKLTKVVKVVGSKDGYFPYHDLVKRLNLAQVADTINDHTLAAFNQCHRIERLTLTGCNKVTDYGLQSVLTGNHCLMALDFSQLDLITDDSLRLVASNCRRLQGLNITQCYLITDASLIPLSQSCVYLKRVSHVLLSNHSNQIAQIE